jgi:hypothetical protein
VGHLALDGNVKNECVVFGGETCKESMDWIHKNWPIAVAARSKVWVCDRLLAGIVVSNPARAWCVLCIVR